MKVKVSPKFQVVIPAAIRKALNILPGQTLRAIQYGDRIELLPIVSIKDGRGMFKGIDTDIRRETDRV